MDLTLTREQQRIRDLAREIARTTLRPDALRCDEEAQFPLTSLSQLAGRGLMGVNIASELGGLDAGVIAYSLAITEISAGDPAVAVTMAVNNMVSEVIQEFGTPSQKEAFIPRMTSGEFSSGSFCLSEPGSGSDAAGMRTRAEKTTDGWVITGTKAWITSGEFAGVFLVWAKTADDEISLFLVEPSAEGISVGPPEEKMGQHASNTVALSFDGVRVAEDALLGTRGQGFPIAMMALDGGRIGIASQSLGIADGALALTKELPELSTAELLPLRARLEAARTMTWRAAWLKEQGEQRFSREASMAKLTASEVCNEIVSTLLAHWPASSEPAHNQDLALLLKFVRDARVTRIYEGTSEIQRVVIARDLIRRGAS